MKNEKIIQNIKDCGKALIDNAESMVNYDYLQGITITCHVDSSVNYPYISIYTEILPEDMIKRLK